MKWLDKSIWYLAAMFVVLPFWGWVALFFVWMWPFFLGAYLSTIEKHENIMGFGYALMGLSAFYFMFLGGFVQRKEIPEFWIWLSDQTIISLL